MKKYITVLLLFISLYAICSSNVYADSTDYNAFVEIIMPTGKLLANYTDEEYKEYLKNVDGGQFFGSKIYEVSSNVDATYRSTTLYAITNDSNSDVKYQLDVVHETNQKTSISASGSLSGGLSGAFKNKVKGDISGKLGIDVSNTTTASKKQTEKLDVIVEKNSKMILYLDGNISISNGVLAFYILWIKNFEGGYEVTKLKNQYIRMEKTTIWKRKYLYYFVYVCQCY